MPFETPETFSVDPQAITQFMTPEGSQVYMPAHLEQTLPEGQEWDDLRRMVTHHMVQVTHEPHGRLTIDPRVTADSHPGASITGLGPHVAVKSDIYDARHEGSTRADLLSQFATMNTLVDVTRQYPDALPGISFNQPFACIVDPNGTKWLLMERVEGTRLPLVPTEEDPEGERYFRPADHPALRHLIEEYRREAVTDDTVSFKELSWAMSSAIAEAAGLRGYPYSAELHDLKASNILRTGENEYTIIDMQVSPQNEKLKWEEPKDLISGDSTAHFPD